MQALLKLKKITVLPDRIELIVCVRDSESRLVTARMADECLKAYPELSYHPCKNAKGPLFGDVLRSTNVPHLLEHLVITLQVRHDAKKGLPAFTYLGSTQWVEDELAPALPTAAKVSLRFRNDAVALSCVKEAVSFLNENC
ncbi:MAG: hypothetical protein Q4A43_01385 [Coriobacteriia bacterium]|nr:hypothetical protein [Coriobacteriia bacterium]